MIFIVLLFLISSNTLQAHDAQSIVNEVMTVLESGADKDYIGEPVSQLEHALQCAQLAHKATDDQEVIIAALLHDIGHLIELDNALSMDGYGTKNHEIIGADYIAQLGFSPKISELIKGHVAAKRYLTFAHPHYYEQLSDASKKTLALQGGPMTYQEACDFERDPLFKEKLEMRRWDEQAKQINCVVLPLDYYKTILLNLIEQKI